jgi:hypothetical protein
MTFRTGLFRGGSAVFLSSLLLMPCFAGKPKTAVGAGVDIKSYKTYRWLPVKALTKTGLVEDDPGVTPLVKAAINEELTARGFQEVREGADLEVVTLLLTVSVPQLEAVIFQGGIPMTFGTPLASMGRYNREGTLAINLIDTRTKKFAWAGIVTEDIDSGTGGGLKKIAPAARKLFSKFPIKKGSSTPPRGE